MLDLTTLLIGGVPLMLVVFGMVAFCKSMGASGKLLTGLSLGIGLVLGLLYYTSQKMPASYAEWVGAGMFGLAIGVVASGVYDQMTRWVKTIPSEQ